MGFYFFIGLDLKFFKKGRENFDIYLIYDRVAMK